MLSTQKLVLTMASLAVVAHASVDFDMDDVPNSCRDICAPIGQLSDRCDTDLRSDNDRDERLLEEQCVCTNDSFNVSNVAALCASCMHQSAADGAAQQRQGDDDDDDDDDDRFADRDDLEDIDNIMFTCGFTSTTWDASASVTSVTVAATAATDINQLTTTIDPSSSGNGNGQPQQTSTASNSNNDDDDDDASRTTTMTSGAATQATEQATTSTPNAASGGLGPLNGDGGLAGMAIIGLAAVFGAMRLH